MKCRKMVVCLVGSVFLLPAVGTAFSDDNPYKNIVNRNPFALTPPPPPPDPTPATPPANIKLTGITTILGNKRALLMVQEGGQKTEQSYILREGQREGQVEVLEINDRAGSVKVKNGEIVSELSFDKDGIKLPSTPIPSPTPSAPRGAPPPPAAGSFGTVKTGAAQPSTGVPAPDTGLRQIPTRQLRLPRSQTPQNQPGQSQVVQPNQGQAAEPSPQAVAQMIAMEVHRQEKKAEIERGDHPPLPPTEVSEALEAEGPPAIP